MTAKPKHTAQTTDEPRRISKYAGLLAARIVLLAGLFLILIPLRPVSFYLFAYLALCPWILSNFLYAEQNTSPVRLGFCARKYFYTPARYTAEKNTGVGTVLLFAMWQLSFKAAPPSVSVLQPAPGVLLFLYLICRISFAAVVRRQIHRYYTTLQILDTNMLPPEEDVLE